VKPPAFQWYPKDCDTDENVRGMDDREFGFYMRCLNHAWPNFGLPGNVSEIARVMHRPVPYVEKIWIRVGKCFVFDDSGRLVNPKQEEQRKEQEAYRESKRLAASTRWKSKADAHALHVDAPCTDSLMRVQCSASASASASAIRAGESTIQVEVLPEKPPALLEAKESPKTASSRQLPLGMHKPTAEDFRRLLPCDTATLRAAGAEIANPGTTPPTNGLWPEKWAPIREAMRPHAQAIGLERSLEADVGLGAKCTEAAGGNPFAAASEIERKIRNDFAPAAHRRRKWPKSLGFWVTELREVYKSQT